MKIKIRLQIVISICVNCYIKKRGPYTLRNLSLFLLTPSCLTTGVIIHPNVSTQLFEKSVLQNKKKIFDEGIIIVKDNTLFLFISFFAHPRVQINFFL